MLVKYKEELTRPVQEAMDFLRKVESQLNSLTNGATVPFFTSGNQITVITEILDFMQIIANGIKAKYFYTNESNKKKL